MKREPGTKLGVVKVDVVEAVSASALETALLAYFAAAGENQRFIDIQYMAYDSTHYSALIVWTE